MSKKKEVQGSIGLRPFKYYYADLTYAASDHIALRLTAGGFFGLANITGAALYYKNGQRMNFYAGALFNFQSNEIHRATEALPLTHIYNDYGYSCRYLSPGIVMGLTLNKELIAHHFILKLGYNIVDKYDFYLKRGIGGQSGYTNKILDQESLSHTLPPFLSLEPSYAILFKSSDRHFIKIQAGANIFQTTFIDHYVFNDQAYSAKNVYAKMAHPVSRLFNISIGYIFYSKK